MRNFNNPYFSRDIAEFWRRWHISLTTWFRDYVYIPMGGSRGSKWMIVRNTFVIFLLSGFWHGANWTFIAWGIYHTALFLPLILFGQNRKFINHVAEGRLLPTGKEVLQMMMTFLLVCIGWIIFRAQTIEQAWDILLLICNTSLFTIPTGLNTSVMLSCIMIVIMLMTEWLNRSNSYGAEFNNLSRKWHVVTCVLMGLAILCFVQSTPSQFIYFQF